MKIIIDGTMYSSAPSGGVFRYFNELIPRLSKFPETEVKVFAQKRPTGIPEGENITIAKDPLPSGAWLPEGRLKQFLRKQKQSLTHLLLKQTFKGLKDSVFHSTYYTPSPWENIPQIVTVHDMISELFVETYDLPHVKALREAKSLCLESADRVIAISNQTKRDLQRIYNIPESKIDVIYHGVDYNLFSTPSEKAIEQETLEKYSLHRPYFFYLGGRLHHKNFKQFLSAFSQSKVSSEFMLAVAGSPWDDEEKGMIKKLGVEKSLIWIPNLQEIELAVVYRNAKALALPSYYEGFGLPLIEAMAAGCPVLASNTGPFPELADGAALLFDPRNDAQMANALEEILNPAVAKSLIEQGKKRAQHFSWDQSAKKHLESYKKALEDFSQN